MKINQKSFDFLNALKENNNRIWFSEHKAEYEAIKKENKIFFNQVLEKLQETDSISHLNIFRINRDMRFKKDKTPYKTNFGASFMRTKPLLRGTYYIHIEEDNSFVGGGFYHPNAEDLFRIRKEFEMDASEIHKITSEKLFKEYFGELKGEDGVKTAPKGFDKNHPEIGLIKKKQFLIRRNLKKEEVFSSTFIDEVVKTFLAMRPFFDYMSDVLSTNLNGEPIYEI